jgi:putative FmdB family regulatory protein
MPSKFSLDVKKERRTLMPIYEYQCVVCEKKVEKLVLSAKEDNTPFCEHENNKKYPMVKVMSAPHFRLRGRGWARDGYSNKITPENNPENKGRPDLIAADNADILENNERHG